MLRTRQEELLETRLEGLRRSLTITDRVLSGRDVILDFSRDDDSSSPAHSAGDRITVELGNIPNLGSNSALVEILGLNYHELAHVRYGVRQSKLSSSVSSSQRHSRFMEAYRALEEARVETLFAAKYAKMKKYFAYPVIKYFVKDQSAWPTAFLFLYGRRYLPLKIRDTFRNIFDKSYGGAREFADIIDKYRVLPFSDQIRIREGARLINEFAKLLEKYHVPVLQTHNSVGDDEDFEDASPYSGSSHAGTSKDASDEETKDDAEEAKEQAKEQDEKEEQGEDGSGFDDQDEEEGEDGEPEEGEGADDGSGDESDGESEQGDGDDGSQDSGGGQDQEGEEGDSADDGSGGSPSDQDGDGEQSPGRPSGAGEGGDQEDGELDKPGPQDKGKGGSTPPPPSVRSRHEPTQSELKQQQEELAGDLSEALEVVLEDQDVQNDVENLRSAMEDDAGLSSSLQRHENSNEEDLKPVTAEMMVQADRLKDVLRQIWAQMEPGWLYGESEGTRIDMARASLAQSADDYELIYVDWREGQQDSSGLEVVVVADESWSSSEYIPQLPGQNYYQRVTKATVISRQIWELMYALQEVEAHVTVLSFESSSRTMYDRDDRVTTKGYVQLWPRGGTDPTYALIEAKRIFTVSEMPNKLLVTISDGEWDRWAVVNCPEILDQMPGVTKVAAVIDTDGKNYTFDLAPKYDVVRRTNGPIFEVMADAVTKIVEGNLST